METERKLVYYKIMRDYSDFPIYTYTIFYLTQLNFSLSV